MKIGLRLTILACLFLPGVGLFAADPQEKFDQLYGEQAKHVGAPDAAEFAEKILTDAEKHADDLATFAFFTEKALEFWQKGLDTPEKTRIGEQLLTDFVYLGDQRFLAKKYPEAAKMYQQASIVAKAIKSTTGIDFTSRKAIAQLRADAIKKAETLEAQLSMHTEDFVAAKSLVLLLVLERDDPKTATVYLEKLTEKKLKDMVPLAAKDISDITPAEAKELAGWYRTLGGSSSTTLSGKAIAYSRAKVYYQKLMAKHEKAGMGLVAVEKALGDVAGELEKLALPTGSQELAPEDSLGTFLIQTSSAPACKSYVGFHKNGKVTVIDLDTNSGAERNKNSPIISVEIVESTWESDEKTVKIRNSWTLPMPLGSMRTTVIRNQAKVEATVTKVAKRVPAYELAKLINGSSTKFPGTYECDSYNWEFRDNGTALRTRSSGLSGVDGKTTITLCKWTIEKGQLVITVITINTETYTFPLPLRKGITKGKHAFVSLAGGGKVNVLPQEVWLTPTKQTKK